MISYAYIIPRATTKGATESYSKTLQINPNGGFSSSWWCSRIVYSTCSQRHTKSITTYGKRSSERTPKTSWAAPTHWMNEKNKQTNKHEVVEAETCHKCSPPHPPPHKWPIFKRALTNPSLSLRNEGFEPYTWYPDFKALCWKTVPKISDLESQWDWRPWDPQGYLKLRNTS